MHSKIHIRQRSCAFDTENADHDPARPLHGPRPSSNPCAFVRGPRRAHWPGQRTPPHKIPAADLWSLSAWRQPRRNHAMLLVVSLVAKRGEERGRGCAPQHHQRHSSSGSAFSDCSWAPTANTNKKAAFVRVLLGCFGPTCSDLQHFCFFFRCGREYSPRPLSRCPADINTRSLHVAGALDQVAP